MEDQELDREICCDNTELHMDAIAHARQALTDPDLLERLSELFKVLGDPTRIRILQALHDTRLCVCDIARLLGLTQSAVSHQLRILKDAKLVRFRREGKSIFYSLDDDHVRSILALGMEHLEES